MITVENLSFSYTKSPFISGMSFSVPEGEIFGFLGPSGAGKSTLQKILIGLLTNYQGSAMVNGIECKNRTKNFYENIGVDFEFSTMYEKLTARENLQFFSSLYETKPRPIDELLEMVGLEQDADKRVADYSKGMKIANAILRKVGCCLSLNWLRKRVDKVAKRFDKDPRAPYYFISNCALCKLKLLFPADIFDKAIDVPFEGLEVYVPEKYDEFLRLIFGNYMELPPESARVPHWGRILISADTFVFEEPKPYGESHGVGGK